MDIYIAIIVFSHLRVGNEHGRRARRAERRLEPRRLDAAPAL
jgi:hypothetical protein